MHLTGVNLVELNKLTQKVTILGVVGHRRVERMRSVRRSWREGGPQPGELLV